MTFLKNACVFLMLTTVTGKQDFPVYLTFSSLQKCVKSETLCCDLIGGFLLKKKQGEEKRKQSNSTDFVFYESEEEFVLTKSNKVLCQK